MYRIQHQRVFVVAAVGLGLAAFAAWQPFAQPTPLPPAPNETAISPARPAPVGANHRETAGSARLGFYGALPGRTMRHAWSMATTVRLATRGGSASDLDVDLAGEMTLAVLARGAGELVLELALPEVHGLVVGNGVRTLIGPDSEFARGLVTPVLVRMTDAGETLGFRFQTDLAAEQRNFLRGLWSSLRFLPRESACWTASERDGTGAGKVEYRWQPDGEDPFAGALHKVLNGYAAPGVGEYGQASGTGAGEACFDRQLGWFVAASWQEDVHRQLGEIGVAARATTRVHTRLVAAGWREVDGPEPWSVAWQPAACESSADRDRSELSRQQRRLCGVSVDQLLADLSALGQRGELGGHEGNRLHGDLTWLLRADPSALARLQQLLSGLDRQLAGAAIAAIGATQLPAAQALLAQLFADGSQVHSTRLAAAVAMVQVQQPTDATVHAFLASMRGDAAVDGVAVAGWLALGTMAARTSGAMQSGALAGLLALEDRAGRSGAISGWLEALGNSGLDEALAAAARYRDDPAVALRVAAVSAVRHVRGDAAWQFAAAALQDAEPPVRSRAVEVLAGRAEPGALGAIASLLRREADGRVRRLAVEALAGRAGEAAVHELLRSVAAGDADASVRSAATAALVSR